MKDIDFDELDRAVNSLMATTESEAAAVKAGGPSTAERVLEISTTAPLAPTLDKPTTVVSVPVQPEPALSVPVARPQVSQPANRGRFMDMVHGPTDMKPRSATATPVATASSREGLTITPRTDAPATPSSDGINVQVDTPKPASFDTMPDPIDIAQPEPTPTADSVTSSPATPKVQSELTESPFLSDAKVEKRPLNPGTQTLDSIELGIADTPSEVLPDTTGLDAGADEPPYTPQAPELSSDLVAIESNEKLDTTQLIDTADAATQIDAPAPPLGSASIAQQYTQKPSTGDQSHAAIYDASQYPEPVTHPAKKKSGWLWVLWVLLLLGIGAGGAILLYKLNIIP
jgi:hypothetical protein